MNDRIDQLEEELRSLYSEAMLCCEYGQMYEAGEYFQEAFELEDTIENLKGGE